MGKKIAVGLFLCFCIILNGCDKKEDNQTTEKIVSEEDEKTAINLYFVEDETGDITYISVEIEALDEQFVWNELQKQGIVSEKCQLLTMDIEPDTGKITLDVNRAFVDSLKSMGTAGENEIITCVVNTYIDAYQADAVKITMEGEVIATGHASYDGFIEKQ